MEEKRKAMKTKTFGIIAQFDEPGELLEATRKVRDEGYTEFDVHSPFPIHGMEEAMGEDRSRLGWIVGGLGVIGGGGALLLEWWTSAVNYPLIVGGKPFFSLPAFIPIVFELTILLAAFGAVFGMFFLNRLPRFYHPLFNSPRFEQATDDGFFISIESRDDIFDAEKTGTFLQSIGSSYTEVIHESGYEVVEDDIEERE